MPQPRGANRAQRLCEQGEAFLVAGDLKAAERAFRAVLAEAGPLEDGSAEVDRGDLAVAEVDRGDLAVAEVARGGLRVDEPAEATTPGAERDGGARGRLGWPDRPGGPGAEDEVTAGRDAESVGGSAAGPDVDADSVGDSAAALNRDADPARDSAATPATDADLACSSAGTPHADANPARHLATAPHMDADPARDSAATPDTEAHSAAGPDPDTRTAHDPNPDDHTTTAPDTEAHPATAANPAHATPTAVTDTDVTAPEPHPDDATPAPTHTSAQTPAPSPTPVQHSAPHHTPTQTPAPSPTPENTTPPHTPAGNATPTLTENHTPSPAHLAARAHIGLGRLALWVGEAGRAEREFRRAGRLRPVDREPLYWLGCAAAHQGAQHRDAYELAELRFSEVVERWPGDGPSLVQRAYVRVRLGRPADALADLRSAERTGPLDAEARWVLAALSGATAPEVARRLGTAARSAMERAGAIGPKGRPRAADEWNRAESLLDRARQLDPGESEFVVPHAVALCLSGRREDGIAVIAGAVRSAPTDRRLAHTLAVMAWHGLAPGDDGEDRTARKDRTDGKDRKDGKDRQDDTARDTGSRTAGNAAEPPGTRSEHRSAPADHVCEDIPRSWSRCAASWAGLLHDTVFWERLRAGAAERYGVAVDDKNLATLRADLQAGLEALMPESDAGDQVSPEALLHRETEAARLLAEAGGLPLATGSAPLVCGPLRIVELGREAELGAFVSAAGDAAPALRQAFSHLGFAQALLRLDRPAEALAALQGLRCPRCRARGGSGDDRRRDGGERAGAAAASNGEAAASHGKAGAPRAERGAVCDPDCAHFDTRNPAYTGQAAKHVLLMRDGRSLALAARLAQGRSALTPAGPDVRRAATSWQRALTHARAIGQGPEVEAIVADTALAAAKALHRAGDIAAAGSTLEAAYALLGEGQHERLKGQLARVLTDRGIAQANRDMDRLEGPAADLRRAVEINPHLHRAQTNLGVVLRILGARMRWSGSLVGCRSRLQEALDRVTAALQHFPGDPELSQLRDLVEADLALVHSELEQGRIGGLP